jgi:hypothetical protein
MGQAGNKPLFDLDVALARKNLANAWYAAVGAGVVYLDQFLLITLLLGEEDSDNFDAAARKFLIRFMKELKPPIEQVKTVAEALWVVGDSDAFPPTRNQAQSAMADLARQIREQVRP